MDGNLGIARPQCAHAAEVILRGHLPHQVARTIHWQLSRFRWCASGEAQQMFDRRNCPSCGRVVCEQCAENRRNLSSIGITKEVRVCDKCFFSTEWGRDFYEAQHNVVTEHDTGDNESLATSPL